MTSLAPSRRGSRSFVHEAFFYSGDAGFLAGTVPYLEGGLRRDEQVLVVASPAHVELLREALGAPAEAAASKARAHFLSMETLGRNPARVIPRMEEMLEPHIKSGHPARAVCETVWSGRPPGEVVECLRHEALVNLAFARARNVALRCPFDVAALGQEVLEAARRDHPYIVDGGVSLPNKGFLPDVPPVLDQPLPQPPSDADVFTYGTHSLARVRRRVQAMAEANQVTQDRTDDLLVAVSEAMANSVRHGGGYGTISLWFEGQRLVCEVRDGGNLSDPLVGRRRPNLDDTHGRGVWLMNELCDLVQLRSVPGGLAVRLHIDAHAPTPGGSLGGPRGAPGMLSGSGVEQSGSSLGS